MSKLKIAVASGKGGTGKTTVSVNLAIALKDILKQDIQLVDCDIEEPNDIIFFNLKPTNSKQVGIKIPEINPDKCTYCGICAEVCEYNAIAIIKRAEKFFISEDLCHGCGACSHFCPENAITEKENYIGEVNKYEQNNLKIIEGKLNISESMPTPVLRETLKEVDKNILTIYDAPPGTSCSMVTTISEADYVLLVTEPTPFGFNDLKLAAEVVKDLKKPVGIIVNRADLGNRDVYEYAEKNNIPILLEIPFEKRIAEIYSRGEIIVTEIPEYKEKFFNIYNKIKNFTGNKI